MRVTRRQFFKYCTAASATLGLSAHSLKGLAEALRNPLGPNVLWIQGAACSGCSVSFLNLISSSAPQDADDVLVDSINLAYHPTLMASASFMAVRTAQKVFKDENYILIVEGGVPTAFNGNTCLMRIGRGIERSFATAVSLYVENAANVICLGECSSWGGIPAAPPNPTGIVGVKELTGYNTINIPGCPPHPDWLVYVLARLIAGQSVPLDSSGRPTALFNDTVHHDCPYRDASEAHSYGQEGRCFEEMGCRGENSSTKADCPSRKCNNGVNWCLGVGSPCIGCVSPNFPGTQPFFGGDDSRRSQ